MKKLFAVTVALSCLAVTNAQFKEVTFGVKGGIGIANQSRTDAAGYAPHTSSSKAGIQLGVFAEMPLTKNIFLQPQLVFATRGTTDKSTYDGDVTKVSLNYIDLPIIALYKHPATFGNLFAGLGPVFSYAVSGNLKREGETKTMFSDELKYWKHGDISLQVTAGAELRKNIIVSLYYQAGFKDIYEHEVVNIKNRSFGFSIGYILNGRK